MATQRVTTRMHSRIEYSAGGTKSEKIDRGGLIRVIKARLRATITFGSGANNTLAAVKNGDAWALVSTIKVVKNASDVIFEMSGRELYWYNALAIDGGLPKQVTQLGDATSTSISVDCFLDIPFWDERMLTPIDTCLDTSVLTALRVEVTWANGITAVTTGTGGAISGTPSLELWVEEAEADPWNDDNNKYGLGSPYFISQVVQPRRQNIPGLGDHKVELLPGPKYRGILIGIQNSSGADVLNLSNVKLVTGSKTWQDWPWELLKDETFKRARCGYGWNRALQATTTVAASTSNFGSFGRFMQSPDSVNYAWAYMDLCKDGYASEAIDTTIYGQLDLIATHSDSGTDSLVVIPQMHFPYRR